MFDTIEQAIEAMKNCYQFEDINMLQHGEMVNDSFIRLINQLNGGAQVIELPPQVYELYHKVKHLILDDQTVREYQVYHDIGKPHCLSYDEQGRKHFYDHEEWSYRQYKHVYPERDVIAELIHMDMKFHLCKGDDINELVKHQLAPTLYFTALAEIIANSVMFGGYDTDSFKIKKKRLLQSGKKLLQSL